MADPRDLYLEANRLRLHLLEWGSATDAPPVLLLHGLQEHAHAWDWVAVRLADAGHHVFALDMRGHGDSEWIGRGGYYHFPDYVADVADVVRQLGGRVVLAGHSMSGNVALLYTGTRPESVVGLVVIEGLGPADSPPEVARERFVGWLEGLDRTARTQRRPRSLEDCAARLRRLFPLTAEIARHLALHGTHPSGDDDLRTWKFDPLHTTRAPQPFYVAQARAFWTRITCPVLYLEGSQSFLSATPDEVDDRVRTLGAARVTIEGAAHHPHLEQPEATTRAMLEFLAGLGEET